MGDLGATHSRGAFFICDFIQRARSHVKKTACYA